MEVTQKEKLSTLIIASGNSFADALAGSYLAAVKEAPIILVNDTNLTRVTAYVSERMDPEGIIYILGGEKDIAYENGMDDFHRISHVPSCATNFPVGHGGTYREPHGGEFTVVALAWLNWQLKNDKKAAKMFKGKNCELSTRKDWTIEKNALFDKLK
jgi:hypothetical protein